MDRYEYQVRVVEEADGWRAVVSGVERVWVAGPFPRSDEAHLAVHALMVRWQVRARALGGWVWRPRGSRLGVALPEGVKPRSALPFEHMPCARAVGPEPASGGGTDAGDVGSRGDPGTRAAFDGSAGTGPEGVLGRSSETRGPQTGA